MRIYLTRRNLLTLIYKLDQAKEGLTTSRTIIKRDTTHHEFPCSSVVSVTAVEDRDYYIDRPAGPVAP